MRRTARTARKALARTRTLEHQVRVLQEQLSLLETARPEGSAGDLHQFLQMGNMLRPEPSSHRFIRIGSAGDGGYVVPSDLKQPTTVVSIGVGPECSADDALAERGSSVWQFDHTVASSPSKNPNVRFIRRGLCGAGLTSREVSPLRELLEVIEQPLDGAWLMLDAEGVEWDVLADSDAPLERFELICIEFHMLSKAVRQELLEVMVRGLRRLRGTHIPVAWHANNFAPVVGIHGRSVPDVLEVTFVRNDVFAEGSGSAPVSLYAPNNPFGPTLPMPFAEIPLNPYGATPSVFIDALRVQSASGAENL